MMTPHLCRHWLRTIPMASKRTCRRNRSSMPRIFRISETWSSVKNSVVVYGLTCHCVPGRVFGRQCSSGNNGITWCVVIIRNSPDILMIMLVIAWWYLPQKKSLVIRSGAWWRTGHPGRTHCVIVSIKWGSMIRFSSVRPVFVKNAVTRGIWGGRHIQQAQP